MKPSLDKNQLVGMGCSLIAHIFFGFSFIAVRLGATASSPLTLLSWRFFLAFVAMELCKRLGIFHIDLKGKSLKPLFLMVLFQPLLYFTAETLGIQMTSASESGTIIATIPLLTLLLMPALSREYPTRRQWISIAVSVCGVILVGATKWADATFNLLGYGLLFTAALSDAIFLNLTRRNAQFSGVEQSYIMFGFGALVFSRPAGTQPEGHPAGVPASALSKPWLFAGLPISFRGLFRHRLRAAQRGGGQAGPRPHRQLQRGHHPGERDLRRVPAGRGLFPAPGRGHPIGTAGGIRGQQPAPGPPASTDRRRSRMRTFFFIIGSLLTLDTLALSFVSNGNLGTYMPAILGIPLVILALFYPAFTAWFATPLGHGFKVLVICLYAAFFLVVGAMTCLLKSATRTPVEPDRDVLIVLGCAVRKGRPTLTLRNRLDTALAYLEQSPHTTVIVSGGKGPDEALSEAQAMADYLIAHGFPRERIILEDQSTSTYENFRFCKDILSARFPADASVAFVTTGFHVYRSRRVAAMHGIAADGIPARDVWYSAPNNYIREGIAVIIYTLTGKLT